MKQQQVSDGNGGFANVENDAAVIIAHLGYMKKDIGDLGIQMSSLGRKIESVEQNVIKIEIQFTDGKFLKPAKIEKIGTKDARLVRLAKKHNVKVEDIKIVDRTVIEQESRRNLGMMISLHNKALQYALTRIAAIEAALAAKPVLELK